MINNCTIIRSVGGAVSSFKSCIVVVDRLSCNVNISWIRKGLLLAGGAPAMPTYLVQRACTAMAGTPSTWATHKDGSDSVLLSWDPYNLPPLAPLLPRYIYI